jgi:N-acetyl-gamma-glutamyl-phosphate/LysW-gamma-L-alpha-aminoadipyl-6-phosphate reductase
MTVRVAVIGGSGYTGGELLRILITHPEVEVTAVTSREYVGKPISQVHPNLRGFYSMNFVELNLNRVGDKAEAVFVSVPHGVSVNYTPKLLEMGLQVIDLSADYRLKAPHLYKEWYGFEHPQPDMLEKAVYGLPELHFDELRGAKLIASPGCNATASILALAPLIKAGLVESTRFVVDVKVGSSEGGINPTPGSHHPERENAIRPYDVEGHRHSAEAEQELSRVAGSDVKVSIIPHAVGSIRGVLASAHSWLREGEIDDFKIWRAYIEFYRGRKFIRIIRGGIHPYPDPKYVIGSNFADLGFAVERRVMRITSFAAIDNMMKGAAGQAVQSFNVSRGFDEMSGLRTPALRPV